MDLSSESSEVLAIMPGNPIIPVSATKHVLNVSQFSVFQIELDVFATGFLCSVSTKLGKVLEGFFTNNHVISQSNFSKPVRLRFEFGMRLETYVKDMPYAFTNIPLDVTFVQLPTSLTDKMKAKGAKFLDIAPLSQNFTGRFYIIQYPLGGKACISAGDIKNRPNSFTLRHEASTEEGSSGSPLVDENLQVVAIHRGHYGGVVNLATVMKYANDAVVHDYNRFR